MYRLDLCSSPLRWLAAVQQHMCRWQWLCVKLVRVFGGLRRREACMNSPMGEWPWASGHV